VSRVAFFCTVSPDIIRPKAFRRVNPKGVADALKAVALISSGVD
jgi:hypothetical protein